MHDACLAKSLDGVIVVAADKHPLSEWGGAQPIVETLQFVCSDRCSISMAQHQDITTVEEDVTRRKVKKFVSV
jgi:hypothetical protein